MLDLERIIDAAVAEAPPPDMTRVRRIVARRRRRRTVARTTAIGGLIVAVAGFLFVPRDRPKTVIATQNTAPPTTPSTVVGVTDFSTGDLRRGLVALGHGVRIAEGGSTLLGVNPTLLCVDGARAVQVFEYASDPARMAWSQGISRDGASITHGNRRTEILWIAPPHFFARGKVIALYVGGDNRLITDLATVLGPTLDPDAPQPASTHQQSC